MANHLSLAKSSLAYAKIAATPTDSAWSQVYNAGNLFACLSLSLSTPVEDRLMLQNLGKELFNNLEAEFFTLEEKNPQTISDAIEKSIKHIPENVAVNFCLVYFKNDVLYLFLKGRGRIIMKRREKLGILLERKIDEDQSLQTASGYLQNGDIVVLESNQFATNVSDNHIAEALQLSLPNDIAESLSIHMHEHADGDQAAIIIVYHAVAPLIEKKDRTLSDETAEIEQEETSSFQEQPKKIYKLPSFSATDWLQKIRLPFSSPKRRIVMGGLTHRKKIFLSITIILLALLVISIIFTKQKQETTKNTALFESIYTPALKKYDEGKALASLNQTLSHEDLLEAEKLTQEGQGKFPKESKEAQQLKDLLTKIQTELGPQEETTTTTTSKEVTLNETDMLAVEKTTSDGRGFSQNKDVVYFVTPKTIFSVSKNDGKKKEVITNDDDWQQPKALIAYQSSLYLLDQKKGVLKYVASSDGFSKNDYFTSAPDLTKAVSMAIDSSIWILFSDGTIKKYTKGQADSFSLKGLTKPFNNPTKIYTDATINNVYILDNGNSRIVKIANDGTFQAEYAATNIKQAKDFEVLEDDKKILILSQDKIWELPL